MNSNDIILYKKNPKLLPLAGQNGGVSDQKRYRVIGVMMFCVACSLLVMRILIGLIAPLILATNLSPYAQDAIVDILFSVPVQVGALVLMPMLFYKFGLKMNFRQQMKFTNFKNTKWYNYLLSILIGGVGLFVVIGVSATWSLIIQVLGWSGGGGGSPMPETFNFGLFALNIVLIGVLPGFCEEFTMRGGFMNTMRGSFRFPVTILLMGLAFGLFHQNITQVFFTFLMGILLAAITIKLKTIWPAIIIHFINNAFSTYLSYATHYEWWFMGNFWSFIGGLNIFVFYILFVIICAVYFGLCALLFMLNSTKRLEKKQQVLLDSGFDVTNKKVALVGEYSNEEIKEIGLEKEVHGEVEKEKLYNPSLRDNAFYIGAIVITGITTIFTFVWGLVV
ncbi:MAG: CPBP family intramembrane metalloprotease [Firmicutes bacterium]|nr:CPBP family intramembrane metalloprotease [Bacillota bacterium]MCL2255793.1 CPBP family intramembrane metalloprotease [Bacillota bacterium]